MWMMVFPGGMEIGRAKMFTSVKACRYQFTLSNRICKSSGTWRLTLAVVLGSWEN